MVGSFPHGNHLLLGHSYFQPFVCCRPFQFHTQGYWKQAKAERKFVLRKKACTRKATAGKKSSTRACMEDLLTLGLGFLQYIVMDGKP
jgi:hypothetical protein